MKNMRNFLALVLALASLGLSAPSTAQIFTQLPAAEQSILKPLASEWDAMSATRKKKWREMATRYPSLSAEEQQRLSARMAGWSRMTPADRRVARDQFRAVQSPQAASPAAREDLKRKWQAYRDLPAEKRAELERNAPVKGGTISNARDAVKRAGTPPLPAAQIPVQPVGDVQVRTAPQSPPIPVKAMAQTPGTSPTQQPR